MTKRFGTVAIVGVGLIGGSIGLAVRQRGLAERVIGIGRGQASLDVAQQVGAVTETTTDLVTGVSSADLVIVCTPVSKVVDFVRAAAASLPTGSIITDAGSTKATIVAALDQEVTGGLPFVGSHPIAGSHETGPTAATADLFVDRDVVITPTKSTAAAVVKTVREFWTAIGSRTHEMSAEEHDRILATTSHLPHLASAALAAATPEKYLPLTGSGWGTATRLASGNPEMWLDIIEGNRTDIVAALQAFGEQLDKLQKAIAKDDQQAILQILKQGKQRRDVVGN